MVTETKVIHVFLSNKVFVLSCLVLPLYLGARGPYVCDDDEHGSGCALVLT